MVDNEEHKKRLNEATSEIIKSIHPKKIVMAGPGTGKTTGFLRLLEDRKFDKERCLVFTFLGVLKKDLEQKLESMAKIFTLHGYCNYLLKKFPQLCEGITSCFFVLPALPEIIKEDWEILAGSDAPDFNKNFQSSFESSGTEFFINRSNYYDAVSFDDSVFRVYKAFKAGISIGDSYDLVLVDEAQDFNKLEMDFIKYMSEKHPILIAGDDDQALYDDFRSASPLYIRDLWRNGEFEQHELPYCTRCTKVIVEAFHDVVKTATQNNLLKDRIDKNFDYCPPLKEDDSIKYPKIKVVETSVFKKNLNYFGEYIKREIEKIPEEEIKKSKEDDNPTVLIIAQKPFKGQIEEWMTKNGFEVEISKKSDIYPDREFVLRKLSKNPDSNLWWRVIVALDKPNFWKKTIKESATGGLFRKFLPKEYCESIILEIGRLKDIEKEAPLQKEESGKPTIKITTFEGAKGLSAYHTFIAGLQNGVLPANTKNITDKDVRKFLVAITRAKKQCHLIFTKRPFGSSATPSVFIDWIKLERRDFLYVDKKYLQS
jgi:superfamily I DNA/RNA helicase